MSGYRTPPNALGDTVVLFEGVGENLREQPPRIYYKVLPMLKRLHKFEDMTLSGLFNQRLFVRNVGWILCLTGAAKVVSFFGHALVLERKEPIMQMPFKELFLVVGTVELAMAAICLRSRHLSRSVAMIAWLSTGLLAYRASLTWVGWQMPCPCLGNFVEILSISPAIADLAMKVVVTYMLVGSYVHLLRSWRAKRFSINSVESKSVL